MADNALIKAAALVERLGAYRPERRHNQETEAFLQAVLGESPAAGGAVERAREADPRLATMLEPLLSLTVAPTMIEASRKRNVIPAVCDVTVDCRLQPGVRPGDVEPLLRDVLGNDGYELEWIEAWGGTRSPIETPLWGVVASFVQRVDPGATAAPICSAGFTDSHWLRESFGTVAYGFFPARMDPELMARLIHSADERVPLSDLELGVDFLRHAARAFA
jgi:acetylornithine deacetylase/succinyl-diaminopimelate desuccinylase-like protein